ncbi:hypothetical protein GWK47_021499 [Chionoecetes opilio]|uniref:Uncharacterized protein n=1 Tax=Chionoecetes opilio TaxID=41210 RepID=A0A8J4XP56_CHIOP|nr:hypothetical protein GWK47_021499 [Chionoecetes opilio]
MDAVLSSKCLQICKEHIPLRRWSGRKHQIPRDRRRLMKKRANLQRKLKKVTYAVAENAIQRQLHSLQDALAQSHVRQREQEEQRAVENIKVNSKFFYSYTKKRLTSTPVVGPLLKENGELEDGPQEMAEMLQTEYQRVFSKPDTQKRVTDPCTFFSERKCGDILLTTFMITREDIIQAISSSRTRWLPYCVSEKL